MTQFQTLEDRLRAAMPGMTRAERQLTSHMLGNFPLSVLGSVAEIAQEAGVSAPTLVRLVRKIGFSGYPEFRAQLHEEMGERLASPIAKHEKWADMSEIDHPLNRFAMRVIENLNQTLSQQDLRAFDAVRDLLADKSRSIYLIGGRLTRSIAEYFTTALHVMRSDVTLLSSLPNTWPPALLDMSQGDVLVVFDIRRYEPSMQQFAELARAQGVEVVLLTDRWVSPSAGVAQHILTSQIEVPSAWDTIVPLVALVEALLSAIQDANWQDTRERMERMEGFYEDMLLFKRMR
ncbi:MULTISPECIES: MurR/RpiR family transcriptional regulator [unclassified Yoonia]|uniref:MurR/RpiR family transcriptional regulator n=1 Tax=unclassified Yoonia TaxID=2629118 RepID=UPI002AFDEA72|nr:MULTISPECIES: MurR/RpiR family transcriptional regulator [unclassified Yoonia]